MTIPRMRGVVFTISRIESTAQIWSDRELDRGLKSGPNISRLQAPLIVGFRMEYCDD